MMRRAVPKEGRRMRVSSALLALCQSLERQERDGMVGFGGMASGTCTDGGWGLFFSFCLFVVLVWRASLLVWFQCWRPRRHLPFMMDGFCFHAEDMTFYGLVWCFGRGSNTRADIFSLSFSIFPVWSWQLFRTNLPCLFLF
jgi:hypothetical protein